MAARNQARTSIATSAPRSRARDWGPSGPSPNGALSDPLPSSSDLENMILIMGVTGSGKSFFINKLKQNAVKEGHSLRSQTKRCQGVVIAIGRTVVTVVDTPGFNDDEVSDGEVLANITRFLAAQYKLGISLKGIIFLHRINDNRIAGSGRRYLDILREAWGDHALPNVALVSTMWDIQSQTDFGTGLRRDQELRREYWNAMIPQGSYVFQFNGTAEMAETIVGQLLVKDSVVLKIQREVVDQHRRLDDTSAGVKMTSMLENRLNETRLKMRQLECELRNAESANDTKQLRNTTRELEKLLDKHAKYMRSQEELRRSIDAETDAMIEEAEEKRKQTQSKWKSRVQVFAAVLGPLVAITNIILPLVGVI